MSTTPPNKPGENEMPARRRGGLRAFARTEKRIGDDGRHYLVFLHGEEAAPDHAHAIEHATIATHRAAHEQHDDLLYGAAATLEALRVLVMRHELQIATDAERDAMRELMTKAKGILIRVEYLDGERCGVMLPTTKKLDRPDRVAELLGYAQGAVWWISWLSDKAKNAGRNDLGLEREIADEATATLHREAFRLFPELMKKPEHASVDEAWAAGANESRERLASRVRKRILNGDATPYFLAMDALTTWGVERSVAEGYLRKHRPEAGK